VFVKYKRLILVALVICGLAGTNAFAGQSQVKPHTHDHSKHAHAGHSHDDHHLCEADIDMPKDFATAVSRIKTCRTTIAEEVAEQHWDELHAPLDEATIITNKLTTIARDSGIPKAKWQEINLAAKELKKQLGDMHTAIDKAGKVDFVRYSKSIDAAIGRLEATAKAVSSSNGPGQPVKR
jgi:hypothetical protein